MKKSILILIVVVIIIGLGIGGYFYWKSKKEVPPSTKALDEAGQTAEKITESATQGVLPDLSNQNPLEDKPDVNPTSKTNPFSEIKTNPFK